MLEEVVVPARRNMAGDVYGFVRFSNVRDVCKLLKAVNSVYFGNFKIVAKVARFDKAATLEVEKVSKEVGDIFRVRKEEGYVGGSKVIPTAVKVVTVGSVSDGDIGNGNEGGGVKEVLEKEGLLVELSNNENLREGVRIGDVLAKVSKSKQYTKERGGGPKGFSKEVRGYMTDHRGQPSIQKLVRKYKSRKEDILWANRGVVASMINGESIPGVQNRIADAGFVDIEITPMGADRVMIRSLSEVDVYSSINEAKDFFDHFFMNYARSEKKILLFQRGAWLRIYGVPIHAWNVSFFKLCIFECGRFLHMDDDSMEKERFDYARVLVATSSFEIINYSEETLIDGELVRVKIVEEWGVNIGDDACLYEEEEDVKEAQIEQEDVQVDNGVDPRTDDLVDKLVHDLVGKEGQSKVSQEVEFSAGFQPDGHACKGSQINFNNSGPDVNVSLGQRVPSEPVASAPTECGSSNNDVVVKGVERNSGDIFVDKSGFGVETEVECNTPFSQHKNFFKKIIMHQSKHVTGHHIS